MVDQSRTHPHFANPPVQETAFGIEFAPLQKWQVPFVGLFWQRVRNRYPAFRVLPSLPSVVEDLSGRPQASPGLSFNVVAEVPPVRCWFLTEDETRLIQVQQDRFIFNWKRGRVDAPYPHSREHTLGH